MSCWLVGHRFSEWLYQSPKHDKPESSKVHWFWYGPNCIPFRQQITRKEHTMERGHHTRQGCPMQSLQYFVTNSFYGGHCEWLSSARSSRICVAACDLGYNSNINVAIPVQPAWNTCLCQLLLPSVSKILVDWEYQQCTTHKQCLLSLLKHWFGEIILINSQHNYQLGTIQAAKSSGVARRSIVWDSAWWTSHERWHSSHIMFLWWIYLTTSSGVMSIM